jgi:hypothetical protein
MERGMSTIHMISFRKHRSSIMMDIIPMIIVWSVSTEDDRHLYTSLQLIDVIGDVSKRSILHSEIAKAIGMIGILHTWGQNLMDHPHIHCIVTGGGLSSDRSRWVSSPKRFFIHVKAMSELFRGKFFIKFQCFRLQILIHMMNCPNGSLVGNGTSILS